MNLFKTWFVAALALIWVVALHGADNPPRADEKPQLPAPPPVQNPLNDALSLVNDRHMVASAFVENYQSPPPGVDLAKELKVTDEQAAKMDAIIVRLMEELNVALSNDRVNLLKPENETQQTRLNRAEAMASAYERAMNAIPNVLTPEQIARAAQIGVQAKMRILGYSRVLGNAKNAQAIGLAPEHVAKLRETEAEAQAEYAKAYEELREQQRQRLVEARKKVLGALTPEQRANYEKLIGAPVLTEDNQSLANGVAGYSARLNPLSHLQGGFGAGRRRLAAKPVIPEIKP